MSQPKEFVITCRRCGRKDEGLQEVRDFRGHSFAVVCGSCARELRAKLDRLFAKYGGVPGVTSCQHSPTIRDEAHLDEEIQTSA